MDTLNKNHPANNEAQKNRIVRYFSLAALLVFVSLVHADPGMTNYARKHLQELASSRTPVFYTACRDAETTEILVFGLGNENALLMEMRNAEVANLATIGTKEGRLVVLETEGGVYSYKRVEKLVQRMVKLPFALAMSNYTDHILNIKPGRECDAAMGS